MAFTIGQVETDVRFAHTAFAAAHKLPGMVLGKALTRYQRELAVRATRIRSTYLTQVLNIALDFSADNATGSRGVGRGAFPAVADNGVVDIVDAPVGQALTEELAALVTLAGPLVPSSATSSTIEQTGAGWTVNAFANKVLELLAGPGEPRQQLIAANDADTLTGLDFTVLPTEETLYRITDPGVAQAGQMGAVLDLPAEGRQDGYLVRLDASGQPYVDYSRPLICRFEVGVPLPPHTYLHGTGHLRYAEVDISSIADLPAPIPTRTTPFPIVPPGHRFQTRGPAGYIMGRELFLIGERVCYQGARSIELRFVPIPPAVDQSREDLFLLPDEARDVMVAYGCLIAARYVRTQLAEGELADFQAEWERHEHTFLEVVRQQLQTARKYSAPIR